MTISTSAGGMRALQFERSRLKPRAHLASWSRLSQQPGAPAAGRSTEPRPVPLRPLPPPANEQLLMLTRNRKATNTIALISFISLLFFINGSRTIQTCCCGQVTCSAKWSKCLSRRAAAQSRKSTCTPLCCSQCWITTSEERFPVTELSVCTAFCQPFSFTLECYCQRGLGVSARD